MSEATPCKSCGSDVVGSYCSACGEKVLTPDDHTLKHYLGALLNAFTFADSKFWNTLKAVVLKPGELSTAYMAGQRVKYMRPVAFFFLANFIYFTAPLFNTFNSTLNTQMHNLGYSDWANDQVDKHLARSGRTLDELTAVYEPATTSNAKLLLVVMVFLLLIPMALLYFRKKQYVSAFVTAAFEMMAFHIWISTILLGLLSFVVLTFWGRMGGGISGASFDSYLSIPLMLLHFHVTIGIGRRFFACSWGGAIWRAVAMLFGLQFALTGYRLVLFVITLWQVS